MFVALSHVKSGVLHLAHEFWNTDTAQAPLCDLRLRTTSGSESGWAAFRRLLASRAAGGHPCSNIPPNLRATKLTLVTRWSARGRF